MGESKRKKAAGYVPPPRAPAREALDLGVSDENWRKFGVFAPFVEDGGGDGDEGSEDDFDSFVMEDPTAETLVVNLQCGSGGLDLTRSDYPTSPSDWSCNYSEEGGLSVGEGDEGEPAGENLAWIRDSARGVILGKRWFPPMSRKTLLARFDAGEGSWVALGQRWESKGATPSFMVASDSAAEAVFPDLDSALSDFAARVDSVLSDPSLWFRSTKDLGKESRRATSGAVMGMSASLAPPWPK